MIVVPGHEASSRVLEATYFGRLLRACGDGVLRVSDGRPVRLPDFVCAAAEQEVTGLGLILGYGMLDETKIKEGVRRLATHLPPSI